MMVIFFIYHIAGLPFNHHLVLPSYYQHDILLLSLGLKKWCGNHIQSASRLSYMSKVFTSSNTLSVLDVSYSISLKNISIHDLRMIECKLGPVGAEKISEILCHNNFIESIDLSYNKIMDSGVIKLLTV